MLKTTGSRLSAALLGYVILIILLLTLNPFYVAFPDQLRISLHSTRADLILNCLLFLPIGFLYRLTGGGRGGAIATSAVISFAIEALQIFVPARVPSVTDFLSNTLGASVGVVIYDLVAARMATSAGAVGRLRLQTPLFGTLYLMLPLLWLNALSSYASPGRWVLSALIGICGAIVFSVWCRGGSHATRPRKAIHAAAATATWFLLGSISGLVQGRLMLAVASGVSLLSAALTLVPRHPDERRFERAALQRLLPVFALYVLLSALWPLMRPLESWHGMFGFTTHFTDSSLRGIVARTQYLAGFALLGYLAGEWRSRDELSLMWDMPRLLAIAAACAVTLEIIAGFQTGSATSFIRGTMAILSALFGGIIYHLLRAHIRFLLGHPHPIG